MSRRPRASAGAAAADAQPQAKAKAAGRGVRSKRARENEAGDDGVVLGPPGLVAGPDDRTLFSPLLSPPFLLMSIAVARQQDGGAAPLPRSNDAAPRTTGRVSQAGMFLPCEASTHLIRVLCHKWSMHKVASSV